MSYFNENLNNLMGMKNLTRNMMLRELREKGLDIGYQTLANWVKTESEPDRKRVEVVAKVFNKTTTEMYAKLIPLVRSESIKPANYEILVIPPNYREDKEYVYYEKDNIWYLFEKIEKRIKQYIENELIDTPERELKTNLLKHNKSNTYLFENLKDNTLHLSELYTINEHLHVKTNDNEFFDINHETIDFIGDLVMEVKRHV